MGGGASLVRGGFLRGGGEVAIPCIKGALDLVEHLCQPSRTRFSFLQLCKQVLSHGVAVK